MIYYHKILQMVMPMTTIYLIRHAEAEGNLCRRMHGQYDSNITPNGLRQLMDLKKRFENVHLDACYTSDLTRAKNTALAVCAAQGLEFRVDPGFREVGIGIWEDFSFGYLTTFHGLKMSQFGKGPCSWSVKDSESYQQYTTRFLDSMESAAMRHDGQTIAIVSHSVVMKGVLSLLFSDVEIPRSANTAVSCLEYDNGEYRVRFLNDSSHLDECHRTMRRQKWWQQDGAQGDDTLWFRTGMTDVDGLTPPLSPIVITALEDFRPVGLICMSEDDEETGRVDYLGLTPTYRGFGLSVQLMGQAVAYLRRMGKKTLRMRPIADQAFEALCRKLFFVQETNGELVLDLTVRLIPME